MQKIISIYGMGVEIVDEKPDIKYKIEHTQDGMVAVELQEIEWKNHCDMLVRFIIGIHSQLFYVSCAVWGFDDYWRQWIEGLKRIEISNESCLVISVDNARDILSVERFLLYKISNRIYVQYNAFLGNNYKKIVSDRGFTPDTCYDFIPKRFISKDDEDIKSEIVVELN